MSGAYLGQGNELWKKVLDQGCQGSDAEEEFQRLVKLHQSFRVSNKGSAC